MRNGPALVLLALSAASCRSNPRAGGGPTGEAPSAATSASAAPGPTAPPPGVPGAEGKPLTGKLVRCGWGVVGQSPGTEPPPWMIALVDVVTTRPVVGPRVLLTELYAGEEAITRGSGDPSLLLQDTFAAYSFSAAGTRGLDGTLPEGSSRVRVATRLEGAMKALAARKPDRCRVVLTDENGDNVVVEGPLDPPWEMQ